MERKNWFILLGICIAAVLLVLSVTGSKIFACGGSGCPMMAKADADMQHEPNMVGSKACSAEIMMQKYQFLATMPIYMDSPAALYARAQELGLSEEQKVKLLAVTEESRKKAIAALTDEQRKKLGVLSDEPIMMSQICPMMRSKTDHHRAHHAAKPAEPVKTAEQTVCPVMGGAINKDIFTDYKGKRVYFCCPACKPEFEKNPEKHLSKLPQFQK